jgi:hypothetical protein
VRRRRAQLSRCSTISGASRRAIRLESSNSDASDLSAWNRLAQETSKQALANRETGQLVIAHVFTDVVIAVIVLFLARQ